MVAKEFFAKAFLIDLDGVLYVGENPVEGAKESIEFLNARGYRYIFVSNTTRRCRKSITERLKGLGFDIPEEYILTPPIAALRRIKREKKRRCFLLTTGDVYRDFERAGITIVDENVDFVVVGDAGENFTFERLNRAFRLILGGAEIIALEKDRYWMSSEGLMLSAGPFVAALEYATGKKAEIVGKPSKEFFELALRKLDTRPYDTAIIGDDIFTDIRGAKRFGMKGILVKTGKYSAGVVEEAEIEPDLIIDSISQLREFL